MLVELGVVEQRYQAVRDVLEGASVTDVARQTVHTWLRHYAASGLAGLIDKPSKPESCPHQILPSVEARVLEMRRAHPSWGPRTIRTHLVLEGVTPPPGRSSIYRTLVRHNVIEPVPRKRSRSDYKRWERSRSMELWQMDIVGRFYLADGTEVKVVTGIDDHNRYCVCARIVARATAKPVCDALSFALRTHGAPDQILSDNGKVFAARFGQGPGPVLFDRICQNNGIRHLLTAPYSPTTTGKWSDSTRPIERSSSLITIAAIPRSNKHRQHLIPGWSTTTQSAHINHLATDHQLNGSVSLLFAKRWIPHRSSLMTSPRLAHAHRESVDGSINKARSRSTVCSIVQSDFGSVSPLQHRQSRKSSLRRQVLFRRHAFAADTALAVALAVAAFVSLAATYGELPASDHSFSHGFGPAVVASMLALTLPLAWRRRYPFSVAVVVVVAFLIARIVVHIPEANVSLLAAWLMGYIVAVYGERRLRTLVLALCYCAIEVELTRELYFVSYASGSALARIFSLVYNMVIVALPWLLGAAIWSLRDRQQELASQTIELQAEREENARQAVFAERVRIARELHDVVAHHVSVIGVQAAGAQRAMERQPGQAAEALNAIETSSRQAVSEFHRLLGFLRRAGDIDELAPQPGLAQLDGLIAEVGRADLTVNLTIDGEVKLLSPTLEVSAFRVIQEALTNIRKHSGATTASVRIQYGTAVLEVEVLDAGPARARDTTSTSPGLGLIGMRERAALHGGHLRVGPRPDGGFAVHATFPLNGVAA